MKQVSVRGSDGAVVIVKAEDSIARVNNSNQPIYFECDGQLLPHPPLPPGWIVKISRSKKRPFYCHPDIGTTWHCPVLLPLQEKKSLNAPVANLASDAGDHSVSSSTITEATRIQSPLLATLCQNATSRPSLPKKPHKREGSLSPGSLAKWGGDDASGHCEDIKPNTDVHPVQTEEQIDECASVPPSSSRNDGIEVAQDTLNTQQKAECVQSPGTTKGETVSGCSASAQGSGPTDATTEIARHAASSLASTDHPSSPNSEISQIMSAPSPQSSEAISTKIPPESAGPSSEKNMGPEGKTKLGSVVTVEEWSFVEEEVELSCQRAIPQPSTRPKNVTRPKSLILAGVEGAGVDSHSYIKEGAEKRFQDESASTAKKVIRQTESNLTESSQQTDAEVADPTTENASQKTGTDVESKSNMVSSGNDEGGAFSKKSRHSEDLQATQHPKSRSPASASNDDNMPVHFTEEKGSPSRSSTTSIEPADGHGSESLDYPINDDEVAIENELNSPAPPQLLNASCTPQTYRSTTQSPDETLLSSNSPEQILVPYSDEEASCFTADSLVVGNECIGDSEPFPDALKRTVGGQTVLSPILSVLDESDASSYPARVLSPKLVAKSMPVGSSRLRNPPHPICALQRLEELFPRVSKTRVTTHKHHNGRATQPTTKRHRTGVRETD